MTKIKTGAGHAARAPKMATPPALPTHDEGYQRFQEVLDALKLAGWERLRIDTYQHPLDAEQPRHQRWTVRHHYNHGTWELHFEPDQYWNPGGIRHPETLVAKIRLDRPLATVTDVICDLFGGRVGRYFPMGR